MPDPVDGSGRPIVKAQGAADPDQRREGLGGADRKQFENKLSDLGKRLDAAKSSGKAVGSRTGSSDAGEDAMRSRAFGLGFGIAAQLIAGVAVGGIIGHFLDRWLGSTPWLLMGFLILGFVAGMLNVIRTAREMEKISVAQSVNAKSVPDDDDEDSK